MALQPIEPGERLIVDLVELTASAPHAASDERRVAPEIDHREARLGLGSSEEARSREEPMVVLPGEQRSVDKNSVHRPHPHPSECGASPVSESRLPCFQAAEPLSFERRCSLAVLNSSPIIPRRRSRTRIS